MFRKRELIIVLVTLTLSLGINCMINYLMMPKVVQFDLKGTVNLFTSEIALSKNITPDQAQAMSTAFPDAIEKAVAVYAKTHRAIVLVSPAVMGGAEDVTKPIQELIKNELSDS